MRRRKRSEFNESIEKKSDGGRNARKKKRLWMRKTWTLLAKQTLSFRGGLPVRYA